MKRITGQATLAILCSLLLAYEPVTGAGAKTTLGRMNVHGPVKVNGAAVTAETTVFAGDRVTTAPGSRASLSLAGGGQLVPLGASSFQMRHSGDRLTAALAEGGLAVLSHARTPIFVEVAGARIHPPKDGGFFVLTVNGNSLRVVARKGALAVEAADRTVEVPEGKAIEASMATPAQQPEGAGATKGLSTFAKVAIVLAVAGAIAGIAVGLNSGDDCNVVSPSRIQCP